MGNAIRYLSLTLLLTAVALFSTGASAEAAESEEGILVGRIAHVEGTLLRYIEEKKDWVATVKDSPFGLEDALYSEQDAKAEFIMPNRTWLRIGENTQIQLIDLNPDATTVDVGSGLARLYNRSENTVIKVTTPYGYVVAAGDSVFDLYVGDESLEVIAIRGKVEFVHERSDARYEVRSGSFSIIADHSETAKGNGTVDSTWDDWNGERDVVWNKRLRGKSYSAGYLPEPLRDEAHVLDETGRWERVYYEGGYREMWRPIRVERGWRPFTAGRWVVYYGDNCWIPDEPFGYITHHYGSWIYVETRRSWYWVPPVTRIVAGTPRFAIGFGWYPGRVGWIHSGTFVGWVPLAAHETYYCYRPWGYRTVVVNPTFSVNVSINLASFFFVNHAVVVHHDYFFSGRRYTPYIERNIGRNVIVNNYNPITVINNTVINNYSENTRRFAYNDTEVFRKPHGSVIGRISENQRIKSEFGSIGKDRIMKDMTRVSSLAEPTARKASRMLTVSSKLVDPDKTHKPLEAMSLDRKEIKGRERQVADSKVEKRGAESERGKKDLRSPREGKKSEMDAPGSQQEAKHGGKELKSQGRQESESNRSRKEKAVERDGGAGKKSASEQTVTSRKKDRQEGLQQEQKSSGGKGSKNKEQPAVERGGGKKDSRDDARRVQEPRGSDKKVKQQPDRQQDQVRQAERKSPRKEQQVQYQQDQPQRQKGSGKQGRPEEDRIAQEQHGKKGGGKKNE